MGSSKSDGTDDAGKRRRPRRRKDTATVLNDLDRVAPGLGAILSSPMFRLVENSVGRAAAVQAAGIGSILNGPGFNLIMSTLGHDAAVRAATQSVGVASVVNSPTIGVVQSALGAASAVQAATSVVGVTSFVNGPGFNLIKKTLGQDTAVRVAMQSAGVGNLVDLPSYNFAVNALGLSNMAATATVSAPLREMLLGLDGSALAGLHNAARGLVGDLESSGQLLPTVTPEPSTGRAGALDASGADVHLASIVAELVESVKGLQQQLTDLPQRNGQNRSSVVVAGAMLIGLTLLLEASIALKLSNPALHGEINEVVELPGNIVAYLGLMFVAIGVLAGGGSRR